MMSRLTCTFSSSGSHLATAWSTEIMVVGGRGIYSLDLETTTVLPRHVQQTGAANQASGCLRRGECEQCQPPRSPARRRASFSEGEGEDGEGERLERPGASGRVSRPLPPSFLPGRQNCVSGETAACFVVARSLARQLARLDAHGGGRKEGGGRRRPLGWALDWRSLARGNVAACFGRRRRTQRTDDGPYFKCRSKRKENSR